MNRRQAIMGLGLATAAAALPVSAAIGTVAPRYDENWSKALAVYRRSNTEFDRLWKLYEDAEELLPDRVDHYFDELNLHMGIKRGDAVAEIRSALCFKEFGTRGMPLWPSEKRLATEAKLKEINERTEVLAEEFMAYQERSQSERKRLRIDELNEAAEAYGRAHYFPAREALMALPAPDSAALLIKMEVSAVSLDDEHAEAVLADARRLLPVGRA